MTYAEKLSVYRGAFLLGLQLLLCGIFTHHRLSA